MFHSVPLSSKGGRIDQVLAAALLVMKTLWQLVGDSVGVFFGIKSLNDFVAKRKHLYNIGITHMVHTSYLFLVVALFVHPA